MINLRPVFLIMGLLTAGLGVAMLVPLIADLLQDDPLRRQDWRGFAAAAVLSLLFGVTAATASWGRIERIDVRQGFLITSLSWLVLVFFASLPFSMGEYDLSVTDAFFEAMSGLTTTGSTVISDLDEAPKGLLLWRSILQWIGGIGIVIMAIAILPMLSIGGMQLFRLESSDTSDKILPGASQIATAITMIYLVFTALCFFAYWLMGMNAFDAINHAMTTIATGGFSTHDDSFGYFLTDPDIVGPVDLVCVLFMCLGSLPFGLYLLAVRGQWTAAFSDSQARFFLLIACIFVTIMMLLIFFEFKYDLFTATRLSAFNVISIMTGTGYASTDYWLWGTFAHGFFFCVMFVGGCAGSTSCGLKVFRLQVVFAALSIYSKRLIFPNGVFIARYNGRPLTDEVFISVFSFFFVYFAIFATVAVILSMFQLDPVTALSAAGTAIANVGPGLGETVGPTGNFQSLPDGAKWTMSAAMLLGRLEIFTVLVLLAPSFWRN
ncbi:TrkH family potassium uptake protein [Parvularcula sp. IMCC14364]|uniref:TrkH family potassium uptake protein n=1 Tax=Parvularcula sp. IMCC14364 TaxID=3067902 RepID=UPI0027425E55|nr:TrkH family potassium uptake protein [Parvularcula sp. IMCC14364]